MLTPVHFTTASVHAAATVQPACEAAPARAGAGGGQKGSAAARLVGLYSPATVAESIFVRISVPGSAIKAWYCVDGRRVSTEGRAPFWMGGQVAGQAKGYSVKGLAAGTHQLRGYARTRAGAVLASDALQIQVVPSLNGAFGPALEPLPNHTTAQKLSEAEVLARTSTEGAQLTREELDLRRDVLRMLLNWNIDPSLDAEHDESAVLAAMQPRGWRAPEVAPASSLSLSFSPDAVFYRKIPSAWPRVALPTGYIRNVQLSTAAGGDGIGFGETIAPSPAREMTIRSQWYGQLSTLRKVNMRVSATWVSSLPEQPKGDRHLIFVDPVERTFVSAYKVARNPETGGPTALYAGLKTPFASLGDQGGSIAAKFAELPLLVQPGEASSAAEPIRHALGGPVGRVWAARVYPATAWDADVRTSRNSCTGTGFSNTGLVPYGGLIQLDPELRLAGLPLSLPARRILEAIQTYGYYVMDFGCSDMGIYTAMNERELEPFGGLYGGRRSRGVQAEVEAVLTTHKLYVVVPVAKKR